MAPLNVDVQAWNCHWTEYGQYRLELLTQARKVVLSIALLPPNNPSLSENVTQPAAGAGAKVGSEATGAATHGDPGDSEDALWRSWTDPSPVPHAVPLDERIDELNHEMFGGGPPFWERVLRSEREAGGRRR